MVTEPRFNHSTESAWQLAEKQRIAAAYSEEDEDFAEAILETPWRDSLEGDIRSTYLNHLKWAASERALGFHTFPSDDLFWFNLELLLPDFEQFLSRASRETAEGRAFMERASRVYPPSIGVISLIDSSS